MQRTERAAFYWEQYCNGKSLQKIGDENGVSKQAVHECLKTHGYLKFQFRPITQKGCIYPKLRRLLNGRQWSLEKFVYELGYVANHDTVYRIDQILRGAKYPNKKIIDKMLEVTGLTYEEMFEEEGNGWKK